MPVYDRKGHKQGITLLNYLGAELMTLFRATAEENAGSMILINKDGYTLSSDVFLNDWAFMYKGREGLSFSAQEPLIWDKLLSSKTGQFQYKGKLITFDTVYPLQAGTTLSDSVKNNSLNSLMTTNSQNYFWKVVSIVEKSDPSLISKSTIVALISFTSFAIIITLVATWLLSRSRFHLAQNAEKLSVKVEQLQRTREHLVQSEKMASLGRMVAGFAHEVDTPVGIAVAATSQIESTVSSLNKLLQQDEVEEEELEQEMETLDEASKLILSNLKRAANLIGSFKRSSVDQTSNQFRDFLFIEMINDVLISLKNKLKNTQIKVVVDCSEELKMTGQPGLYDQLLTNLMINSMIHAFDNCKLSGQIDISVTIEMKSLHIIYKDNGQGMEPTIAEKIFEPFFTTDRVTGTGLGMYLCYNIINTELHGKITCQSHVGQGTQFDIKCPITEIKTTKGIS